MTPLREKFIEDMRVRGLAPDLLQRQCSAEVCPACAQKRRPGSGICSDCSDSSETTRPAPSL